MGDEPVGVDRVQRPVAAAVVQVHGRAQRIELRAPLGGRPVVREPAQHPVAALEPGRAVRHGAGVAEVARDLLRALGERRGTRAHGREAEIRGGGCEQDHRHQHGDEPAQRQPRPPRAESALAARGGHERGRRRLAGSQRRGQRIAAGQGHEHLGRRAGTSRRILFQALHHETLHGRIDLAAVRAGRAGRLLAVRATPVRQALGHEGALPREQLVEQQAERVEVRLLGGRLVGEALGREVGGRAGEVRLARGAAHREAEVGDAGLSLAVEHHVGGLEIAVQDAPRVRGRQPRRHLPRDLHRLGRGQPADAAEQRGEVLAVHVLHADEVAPLGLADVVDPADVRVRHLPRAAHLGAEALHEARVRGRRRRQELERDGNAEGQVVGAVDFAHAAAAEQANDAVAAGEHLARGEGGGRLTGPERQRRRRRARHQRLRVRARGAGWQVAQRRPAGRAEAGVGVVGGGAAGAGGHVGESSARRGQTEAACAA